MSTARLRLIVLIGAGLIVLTVAVGLVLRYALRETIEVPLPTTSASAPSGGQSPSTSADGGLVQVEVTTDTVQDVIARTLYRPMSYSRTIHIESFFDSGSAAYTITAAVLDGAKSFVIDAADETKHVVMTSEEIYIWYAGDDDYYTVSGMASDGTPRNADEYQMILTYEDVLALKTADILDAAYEEYDGENCIKVTYESEYFKYRTTCYISIVSGLLTGAEQYDGDTLVYRMTVSDYTAELPEIAAFTLPDGLNVLGTDQDTP